MLVPGAMQVAISPDARTAWVVGDHDSAPVWTISRVDLTTGEVVATAPLDFVPDPGAPLGVVVTPDGGTLLTGAYDRLVALDATDMTVTATYMFPSFYGMSIALTPDGRRVFVGASDWNQVETVDLATGVVGPRITTGSWPVDIAISPDGRTAYTANQNNASVTPIDVASLTTRPDIQSSIGNIGSITMAPDGASAIVSNLASGARVDFASGTMEPGFPVSGSALGTVLMPDGRTLVFIDQMPNRLFSVDTITGEVGSTVPLPGLPLSIAAIAPSQAPTAAFSNGAGLSGQPTAFDASASTATCGDISAYRWDYGDGTVETTSTPTAAHVYAVPGTYGVTLTVTDSAGTSTTKAFTGQAMVRNGGPTAQVAQEVAVAPAPVAAPHFTG